MRVFDKDGTVLVILLVGIWLLVWQSFRIEIELVLAVVVLACMIVFAVALYQIKFDRRRPADSTSDPAFGSEEEDRATGEIRKEPVIPEQPRWPSGWVPVGPAGRPWFPEDILHRLGHVLAEKEHSICLGDEKLDDGAPGRNLERLLGLPKSSESVPDIGRFWELKYTGGNYPVTLFHLESCCSSYGLEGMRDPWGRKVTDVTRPFERTVCNKEPSDLEVVSESGRIYVRGVGFDGLVGCWEELEVRMAFYRKVWNVLLVHGCRKGEKVWYDWAELLSRPRMDRLIDLILDGGICVGFDVVALPGGGFRIERRRFRLRLDSIDDLYGFREKLEPDYLKGFM